MGTEELIKLAEKIKDKKATDEEEVLFLTQINSQLLEVSELLKELPKKK